MISCKALNQVQLEVLVKEELLASLGLLEGVVSFCIAGFDCMFFKILDSLGLQVSQDSLVEIKRYTIKSFLHLKGVLDIDLPLFFTILSWVQ